MDLSILRDGSEQIHYQDPAIPIYIGCGRLSCLSGMTSMCHWHEGVELILPIQGYLNYNINGNTIRVNEGSAIFVTPRQMHYGSSADGTDCQYLCICFKPELLCTHKYLYDRYIVPIAGSTGPTHLLIEKGKPEHDIILKIIHSIAQTTERDLSLMAKLFDLWQGIYAISKIEDQPPADKNVENLKQMLDFIAAQYPERIRLSQIASAGGVCRSKCCQIFQKYMGSTPNAYLTSYRLERATELLRETDRSITEIANSCGFGSSSYFAESFVKSKGCTPTAYRRNYHE